MSADEHDRPGDRIVRPAPERRGGDRRAAGARDARAGAPGGVERRAADRRRGPILTRAARDADRRADAGRPPGPAPAARSEAEAARAADTERRRRALRSMLAMADERQARAAARRRDRPVMAPGVAVRVLVGPFEGEPATVTDADYISNRVLVRLDEIAESLWLGFAEVGVPRTRTDGGARGEARDGRRTADRGGSATR